MIPVYRTIAAESGSGMMARMHGIMASEMAKRTLFPDIKTSVEEEMLQGVNSSTYSLLCHVAEMCKALEEQMGTYKRAEMRGPGSRREDLERVGSVVGRARGVLGEVQGLAARAGGLDWD